MTTFRFKNLAPAIHFVFSRLTRVSSQWLLPLILLLPSGLWAQVEDDPVVVPLDYAIVASTDAVADPDSPPSVTVSAGGLATGYAAAYAAGEFSSEGNLAKLRPGKPYSFTIWTSAVKTLSLQFHPPSGYRVLVENIERQRVDFDHESDPYLPDVFSCTVRLDDGSGSAFGAASSLRPSRIVWTVGLGTLRNGRPAGQITMRQKDLSSLVYSPSSLYYDVDSSEVEVITDSSGTLRQVYATNGMADIVAYTPYRYYIRFYSRVSGQISADKTNGVYTFTGNPLFEYVVENPDYPSASNRLRITKTTRQGGATLMTWTELTKNSDTQWRIIDWAEKVAGDSAVTGPSVQFWTYGTSGNVTTETMTVSDGASVMAYSSYKEYTEFPWGTELTRETVGGSNGITTDYTYYTDAGRRGAYRRLKSTKSTGGSWVQYDYYDDLPRCGQIKRVYRPYLDSPAAPELASDSSGDVTLMEYTTDWTGKATLPSLVERRVNGVTVAKSTFDYSSEDYTDRSSGAARTLPMVVTVQHAYSDATRSLATVSKVFRADADGENHFFPGLLHSMERPDGTMTVQVYMRGLYMPNYRTFTPVAGASEWMSTAFVGTSVAGESFTTYAPTGQDPALESNFRVVAGKSSAMSAIHSADGLVIWTEAKTCESASSWPVIQRDLNAYQDGVFLAQTSRDTGNANVAFSINDNDWSAGRLDATTDASGVVQVFTYDRGGRVSGARRLSATGAGVTIPDMTSTMQYDAAGRLTSTTLVSGGESIVSSKTFDTAGRPTSETAPGGITTSYSYTPSLRRTVTTTPAQGTIIEDHYLDGRVKSVTGTGVVAQYPSYSVQADGTQYVAARLGSSAGLRRQESWADWLGRPTKTSRPGFGTQPASDEIPTYDGSTGRLLKSARTGFPSTIFAYDAFGQVIRSGSDLDGNGTLELAGDDRLSDADSYVEKIGSDYWKTATSVIYPTAGSAVGKTASLTRQRLTGLNATLREEVQSTDAEGNVTTRKVEVGGAALVVVTTTLPGIICPITERSVNGLPVSATGADGLTVTRSYDAAGRLVGVTDPRTGTGTISYVPGTALQCQTTDAAGNVLSTTAYDSAGRVQAVQDAAGKVVRYEYNVRNQLVHQWGAGTYPVSYNYDSLGQRTEMVTYRDRGGVDWNASSWPGSGLPGDTTTWTFDEATGLLTKKTDANGKYVEYTYNVRGQTAQRFWARLTGTSRVSTTYTYFGDTTGELPTGELKSITYNDGTPSVGYTYTRMGQVDTVTDATGTRDYVYDPAKPWRLNAEALSGFFGDRVLSRIFDESTSLDSGETSYTGHTINSVTGRATGFRLGTTGTPSADLEVRYATSNIGRFAGLTASRNAGSAAHTFVYGYTPNSSLVASMSVVGSPFMVTRTYEPNRDLLSSIEAKWVNGTPRTFTKFDYTYDGRRKRTSSVQAGDAYADYGDATHQIYDYNDRGELKTAATYLGGSATATNNAMSGRHHEFSYDAIGNRVTSNTSGNSSLADNYQVNALNQYTSRENNAVYAGGTADADATVSVAGSNTATTAGRVGKYWGDVVSVDNVGHAFSGPLSIFAAKPGSGSGGADLVRSETRTAFAAPDPQSFTYDWDGNLLNDGVWDYQWDAENRLIRMETTAAARSFNVPWRVLNFKYDAQHRRVEKTVINGTNAQMLFARKFVYDGWSLVAEIDSSSLALKRSFTWGAGAPGGVGGLVELSDDDAGKSFFPSFDGNGNVASLINAGSGGIEAAYEYSPFGELLRAEGAYSLSNPYTFSTYYRDTETGLVYYGYRYYDAHNGRFVGRDPIGENGGLNLYGFCGNDGANNTDYLGQSWFSKALKKLRHFSHQVVRAFTPIRALRAMDSRSEAWGEAHQRELVIAAAIIASIYTYGAASAWAESQMVNAAAQTAIAAGGDTLAVSQAAISAAAVNSASTAMISAAAGGVSAGVVSGAITGQSANQILRSSLLGAASAALVSGVGFAWSSQGSDSSLRWASAPSEGALNGEVGPSAQEIARNINVGRIHESLAETNALVFPTTSDDIVRMRTLVIYSSRELGYGGGNTIIESAAASGFVTALNVDTLPKDAAVMKEALHKELGNNHYKNMLFERHGGSNGYGDSRMLRIFSPQSDFMNNLAPYLDKDGRLWLNWCYGGSYVTTNPSYLPQLSRLFGGAEIYYGTGIQNLSKFGISSSVALPNDTYNYMQYLDYQRYAK